jgi:hypothetical protein
MAVVKAYIAASNVSRQLPRWSISRQRLTVGLRGSEMEAKFGAGAWPSGPGHWALRRGEDLKCSGAQDSYAVTQA